MDDLSKLVLAVITSGALASLITAVFQHRKLGADATEVITKAAASMVDTMQGRMDDQSNELERVKTKLRALEQAQEDEIAFRRSMAHQGEEHTRWDRKMVRIVRRLDPEAEVEDPPPLYTGPKGGTTT